MSEPRRELTIVVAVATYGRKDLLGQFLMHLDRQTRPPDEVVISAPDASHVDAYQADNFKLTAVYGKRGLCAQRNRVLDSVLGRFDIITFFDDDFLPADTYLDELLEAFDHHPDYAAITGAVLADGATGPGISFADGVAALRAADEAWRAAADARPPKVVDKVGAYGCNMSFRAAHIGSLRFDERLVLYGWQEDVDFTSQLRRFGRIVSLDNLCGVHLGIKQGRVSGVRFGYSQVVNPLYLVRKGTMPLAFALALMCRNIAANLLKSLWSEPYIDRRGRLKGNFLAFGHVLKGQLEPEFALKL